MNSRSNGPRFALSRVMRVQISVIVSNRHETAPEERRPEGPMRVYPFQIETAYPRSTVPGSVPRNANATIRSTARVQ
jgi:hypothetical protein